MASSYDAPLEQQLELEARAMGRTTRTEDTWERDHCGSRPSRSDLRGS